MTHRAILGQLGLLLALALGCLGGCIHDQVQRRITGATAVRYRGARASGRSLPSPRPIRISAFYTSVPEMVLRPEERQHLNASVQEAIGRIAELLAVIPVVDPLLLSRDPEAYCKSVWRNQSLPNFNKCGQVNANYQVERCLDVVIPDEHLSGFGVWTAEGKEPVVLREDGTGVPGADFILYVKAADTRKCRREPSVIAYASYCKVDQVGRPIAGSVTFCHARLRGNNFDHERTKLTTIHELFHALGFSKDLFNSWLECSLTTDPSPHCSPRGSVTNTDRGTVRIFTPNVVAQMRRHFHTSSSLGGPLENWLQAGLPSSHWESRVLQGSIMTAALGAARHTFIDPVTLGAMADTGWYRVLYQGSQPLVWGQGRGENFGLTETCHENSSEYFCTGSGLGCHYLHLDKASCLTDDLLDGCRIYKPLANRSECWKAENAGSEGEVNAGEIYGVDSRCFLSNLSRAGPQGQEAVGRCYLHRCSGLWGLEVRVQGSDWLPCRPGDSVQVPGYLGLVSCPAVLCREGAWHQDPAGPQTTPDLSPASPTRSHLPDGATRQRCRGRGQGFWLAVRLQFSDRPPCPPLQSGEVGGEGEEVAQAAGIPRGHVSRPRVCGPHQLCLQFWERECGQPSVQSLQQRLQGSLQQRPLLLRLRGHNCTILSARMEPPAGTATAVTAACASLSGLLVLAVLGLGTSRLLRRGRRRVGTGQGADTSAPGETEHKPQP
ncbi:ciliated left-right organizer metallopeptidase [Mobula hypostoma]|uniref:ciliated left-right organizer metallopeptidase n=1 Tax=Mobula hypostoma TaxID=723540 RepID=UPI002FC37D31